MSCISLPQHSKLVIQADKADLSDDRLGTAELAKFLLQHIVFCSAICGHDSEECRPVTPGEYFLAIGERFMRFKVMAVTWRVVQPRQAAAAMTHSQLQANVAQDPSY